MKISEDQNTITIDEIFDGRVVSFDYRAVKDSGERCTKCAFYDGYQMIEYCPSVPCSGYMRKDGEHVYFETAFFEKEDEK